MAPTKAEFNGLLENQLAQIISSLHLAAREMPPASALPQHNSGLPLLDVRMAIFIHYLQEILRLVMDRVHLIVDQDSVTRAYQGDVLPGETVRDVARMTHDKLGELRLYLERGVNPLEKRIKLRAEELVRKANGEILGAVEKRPLPPATKRTRRTNKSKDDSTEDDKWTESSTEESELDDCAYSSHLAPVDRVSDSLRDKVRRVAAEKGLYRPPKINATSLPTTQDLNPNPDQARKRGGPPIRARAVDDYITTEMTDAPLAEPSIGSAIAGRGKSTKTDKARKSDQDKTRYEEENFVRLPQQSKTEGRKRKREDGYAADEFFLSSLAEMGDRVSKATQMKKPKLY